MPSKKPKKDTPNFLSFAMYGLLPPVVITLSCIAWLYSRQSESEADLSHDCSTVLGASLSMLCPLYIAMGFAQNNVHGPIVENYLTHFSRSMPYNMNAPVLNHITMCNTPEDVEQAKNLGYKIDSQSGRFNNTLLHLKIVNNDYKTAIAIYQSLSDSDKTLANRAKDIYGRTIYMLSVAINGPNNLLLTLMNEKNILTPDKYGTTPLMMAAAGFVDRSILQNMLNLIPNTKLQDALHAVTRNGLSIYEFSEFTREINRELLSELDIDPDKASNYCHNAFNTNSEYGPICLGKKSQALMRELKFELGASTIESHPYTCVKATENNLKKIERLATDTAGLYKKARDLINQELYKGNDDVKKKIWADHCAKAKDTLKEISHLSTLDKVMSNQQANKKILSPLLPKKEKNKFAPPRK